MFLWSLWIWGAGVGGAILFVGIPVVLVRALWHAHDEIGHIIEVAAEARAEMLKHRAKAMLEQAKQELEIHRLNQEVTVKQLEGGKKR